MKLKQTFSRSSEVVDVICSILRAGFSETEPGPFVFPPQLVTEFIISPWNNRAAIVVNTASVFVTSLANGNQKKFIGEALGHLLPWIFGLLHQLAGKQVFSLDKRLTLNSLLEADLLSFILSKPYFMVYRLTMMQNPNRTPSWRNMALNLPRGSWPGVRRYSCLSPGTCWSSSLFLLSSFWTEKSRYQRQRQRSFGLVYSIISRGKEMNTNRISARVPSSRSGRTTRIPNPLSIMRCRI